MTTLAAHTDFLQSVIARQKRRRLLIDPTFDFSPQVQLASTTHPTSSSEPSKANVVNYSEGEETVRNDYTAWYNSSSISGADYILGAKDNEICEEYPALRRLMDLKAEQIDRISHPPLHLPSVSFSPANISSAVGPNRFDVILITPHGTWDETASLPIRNISADPGFVFLWVGRGDQDGLEKGRECLAKWGFRRAEDIVWVKPTRGKSSDEDVANSRTPGAVTGGLLASQKEHCLMGIRGTVRRSTDGFFAHCNVDTDVMIWSPDEDEKGERFPPYLYTLIESFCLGTRRLHLSPNIQSSRRGWVTASTLPPQTETMTFDPTSYPSLLPPKQDGRDVLPFDGEIDHLRPKSPVRNNRRNQPSQNAPQTNHAQPPRPPYRGASRPPFTPDIHQSSQPTLPGQTYAYQQIFQRSPQPTHMHPPRMASQPQQFGQRVYNPSADTIGYNQMSGHQSYHHTPSLPPSPLHTAQHPSFGIPSSPAQFYDPQLMYMMNQLQQTHLDPQYQQDYDPQSQQTYDPQYGYDNGGGHMESGVWYPPNTNNPPRHGQPGQGHSWQHQHYR